MTLSEDRIAVLLKPYLGDAALPVDIYARLGSYLDLLLKWNARTNLTAIRDPEEIVRRHFGESLFAGAHLVPLVQPETTLLDFGSGAGFPGVPIQLLLPELRVTLAESQGKKASFLREAVRTLGLKTAVWAERVEAMPVERRFDVVALRAVDKMDEALLEAGGRIAVGGLLVVLGGRGLGGEAIAVPGSTDSFLYVDRR